MAVGLTFPLLLLSLAQTIIQVQGGTVSLFLLQIAQTANAILIHTTLFSS